MAIVAAMIDSREPAWVQRLAFGGAACSVIALDHGDVLATTADGVLIAVERKTASDLLGSLADGRIWPQLAGMRKLTPWCYLVITGQLAPSANGYVVTDRGVSKWTWASVSGALIQAQELGVIVVQEAGDSDFEPSVMRLSGRDHGGTVQVKPLKAAAMLSAGEKLLCALPGVGLERAQAVMAHCGRACWALAFLTMLDSDEKVAGVGLGVKRKIRAALGLKDNEQMWLRVEEGDDE